MQISESMNQQADPKVEEDGLGGGALDRRATRTNMIAKRENW